MPAKKRIRTTHQRRALPRSTKRLERLATHYASNDTSEEMENGEWVEPAPMVTTSLRLPGSLVAALKEEARRQSVRYTVLLRQVLESHVRSAPSDELKEIRERLARIERQVGPS